jgi:cytochrome c
MPMDRPQSLTNEEVYARERLPAAPERSRARGRRDDATTLVAVQMPNRNGFMVDDRPTRARSAA